MIRSGLDTYSSRQIQRNPIGINAWRKYKDNIGEYIERDYQSYSLNNDLIVTADKKIGKFGINALVGGTIYYYQNASLTATTKSGLVTPGFYSLKNSRESPTIDPGFQSKQVNSLYGSVSLSYGNFVFIDVTGRNDWSSTLPKEEQSYFYPSIGGSLILSEIIPMPEWIKFWKARASWTESKSDLGIYAINKTYNIGLNAWDGLNSADYPSTLRGKVNPLSTRSYEIGTAFYFLKDNRLKLDFAYYSKLECNLTREVDISYASGYNKMLINTQDEYERRGFEVTVEAVPLIIGDFKWNLVANWSKSHRYRTKIDPLYATDKPWEYEGARTDYIESNDYQRSPSGEIVHNNNGMPINPATFKILGGYSDPDWIWGLSNSFSYKNWTLSFNFDGRVGGRMFNELDRYSWANGSNPASDTQWRYDEVVNGKKTYIGPGVKVTSGSVTYDNYGRILEDTRVFAPNDIVTGYEGYIREWAGRGDNVNWLQSGSFFKLRELSLTYQLPLNTVNKLGMSKASVSLVGQNLLLWVKEFKYSDPDKGLGGNDLPAPSVRYLGFNINLTF